MTLMHSLGTRGCISCKHFSFSIETCFKFPAFPIYQMSQGTDWAFTILTGDSLFQRKYSWKHLQQSRPLWVYLRICFSTVHSELTVVLGVRCLDQLILIAVFLNCPLGPWPLLDPLSCICWLTFFLIHHQSGKNYELS